MIKSWSRKIKKKKNVERKTHLRWFKLLSRVLAQLRFMHKYIWEIIFTWNVIIVHFVIAVWRCKEIILYV